MVQIFLKIFLPKSISVSATSCLVREAFPSTTTKQFGALKVTRIVVVSVKQANSTGCTQHSIKSLQSLSAPSLSLESLSRAALFAELEAERKNALLLSSVCVS